MVIVILEGLWLISNRIIDSLFFVKFHRSGTAIIFSFSTIMEQASKKLLIKERLTKTSSWWWVSLWKDYGWFLIDLSIFDFSSNLTVPHLHWFSVFELSLRMLVIHQKISKSNQVLSGTYQDGDCYSGRRTDGLW